MNFLKKHYEKIILGVFLLIFIFSLIRTILVLNKSLEVKEEDLELPKIPADYLPANMKDYDISVNFKDDKKWDRTHSGDPEDETRSYMDFIVPYKAKRCIKCMKIIPLSAYYAGKCPLCNEELEKPKTIVDTDVDRDGDRILDKDEQGLNLDNSNPDDAYMDMDEDGFSNLCEYLEKTDLKDAQSFPNPSIRLFVKSIYRKKLPLLLEKVVQKGGEENKSKWEIRAKTGKTASQKGMKLRFFKLGDVVDLNEEKYTIVDIVSRLEAKNDKNNRPGTEEVTEIVIKKDNDDPITVSPGSFAQENKDRITLEDVVTGHTFVTSKGSSFDVKIKDKTFKYTVSDVNYKSKDKEVTIKDNSDAKEYKISSTSRMEEQDYLKIQKQEEPRMAPGEEAPDGMIPPGGNPPASMLPPVMLPPQHK